VGPLRTTGGGGEANRGVFADLGLPDAEERLVKATLAIEIGRIIKARKLTQQAAAELMGIDQPKVSHVLTDRLAGYSTERLMGFLTALGRDIRN
jgi:predicted XRE-type DNA-binding protein